jgi:hypothetical protein
MIPMKRVSKATTIFAIHVLVVGAACARAGSTTDGDTGSGGTSSSGGGSGASGGDAGHPASSGAGSSSGSAAGSSSGAASDDGSVGTGTDDASDDSGDGASDDSGEDGAASDASSSGSSGASGSSGSSGAPPTYTCVTGLSPAPVCDSKHTNCLCTADADCNSGGTNIGNKGGCHSGHCAGGACTGGQFTDSAGCSIVGAFCNLGNANACPTGTTCEENHGQCGGSVQCCWCTSDSACPVSCKCINDGAQKQCGSGTCTGTGTSWDGMHCQLTSPGIPMCSMQ